MLYRKFIGFIWFQTAGGWRFNELLMERIRLSLQVAMARSGLGQLEGFKRETRSANATHGWFPRLQDIQDPISKKRIHAPQGHSLTPSSFQKSKRDTCWNWSQLVGLRYHYLPQWCSGGWGSFFKDFLFTVGNESWRGIPVKEWNTNHKSRIQIHHKYAETASCGSKKYFCHVVLVSKAASSHDICGSTEKLFQETLKGGD